MGREPYFDGINSSVLYYTTLNQVYCTSVYYTELYKLLQTITNYYMQDRRGRIWPRLDLEWDWPEQMFVCLSLWASNEGMEEQVLLAGLRLFV